MNKVDVCISPQDLLEILNRADQGYLPYLFNRTPGGPENSAQLVLVSEDWKGPIPTIQLLSNGTWRTLLPVEF